MAAHPTESIPLPLYQTAFPWRVHAALEWWGVRADRKAGVLLAHQGGGLVLAATSFAGRWSDLTIVALGLLLVAMCAGTAVIVPALGSVGRLARERRLNLIYFGHLRGWTSPALAERFALVGGSDEIAMLSRQIVTLSRLNWRKHRLLQVSAAFTLLAMCTGIASLAGLGVR